MRPQHRNLAYGAVITATAAALVATAVLMPPSNHVKPGDDVAKIARGLKAGQALEFSIGVYRGLTKLDGLHDVPIKARGAVFDGGLKLSNFRNVSIDGGEYEHGAYGVMAVDGSGLTLNQPYAHDNQITGILTGAVDAVTITGGESSRNKAEWGVYLSRRCKTARVTGLKANANGKGLAQVNLDEGGGSDIQVSGCTSIANQQQGHAAAIQFAYVTNGRILNNDIRDHCGRVGIEVWQRSRDVIVDQNRFGFRPPYGTACVSVSGDSKATIGPMNTADPRVPLVGRG